jgi:hypothetical protein
MMATHLRRGASITEESGFDSQPQRSPKTASRRAFVDNSLTFGGFHYNDPRKIYVGYFDPFS